MLTFYVRHGFVIDKVHEIISFKQSKWLEKNINFKFMKRNKAKNDFEKDFCKLINNAFCGKTMENVRKRVKIEFIKEGDNEKFIEQESKLTFNGIHKSRTNSDSYTFKQNEVFKDKPVYLGFAVLEFSKLLMYETYYDKLQTYFGEKNIQLHSMDFDIFVLSVSTEDIIKDLKNLEDLFDFSNLNETHEIFSNENKKKIGKFKIETRKNIWIDEFVCLRSKMFAFNCGDDSKIKLKGNSNSYSKEDKFEEFQKGLVCGEYQQKCDIYLIRSLNHEMYLQRALNFTLNLNLMMLYKLKFYKNSTGHFSDLLFLANLSEHYWERSSIQLLCIMMTETGGCWLLVNPKHYDYQLSKILTLVNVTKTTRL